MLKRFYRGESNESTRGQPVVTAAPPRAGIPVAEAPPVRTGNGEHAPAVANGSGGNGSSAGESGLDFIAMRVDLHRLLIDRINLTTIDQISRTELAETIRPMVKSYVREQSIAINAREI